MSTHILADVERVCDTVGIINQGKLVIQAPQQELLERYAAPVFLVEAEAACVPALHAWAEGLRSVPWVSSVALQAQSARILVGIWTRPSASWPLCRRAGVIYTRYELGVPSLEEVFMQLVSEGGG